MSEKDGILLAIECVNRHNHGFIKCHPMFIRGHNEAVKAITKELQSLIETAPIGGDYFEGFSEGIKVGRNEMIESARASCAAVTAERDRMRQSVNSMIVMLEMTYDMLERPTHNSLDVGFRHSPLSQKEIIQRLTETCLFVRADLSKTLDEARAALEGVTEPEIQS